MAITDRRNAVNSIAVTTTAAEIDAVFDRFDSDGGGYLDVDEAKVMIRTLQAAADKADFEKRRKARMLRVARAEAAKKAAIAMETQAEEYPPDEFDV